MKTDLLSKCYTKFVTQEQEASIKLSADVANCIFSILEERGMSQKDFARLMNKTEAEISRWLSGTHNFTLSTIAAISIALKTDILSVPSKDKKLSPYNTDDFIPLVQVPISITKRNRRQYQSKSDYHAN
ncbi:MAG: helix-turn-helix domain-containing protein [Paludibacteraceae bacterium]